MNEIFEYYGFELKKDTNGYYTNYSNGERVSVDIYDSQSIANLFDISLNELEDKIDNGVE